MTAVITLTVIIKLERDTEIDFVDRFYLHRETLGNELIL